MFGINKENEDKSCARSGSGRQRKKEKPTSPGGIVDWADRIIQKSGSGDKISGRKFKMRPKGIIAILTLTMLFAVVLLLCIYK